MKFEATYSFNVRRHVRAEIEADSAEEAERIARDQGEERIEAEIVLIQNSDGFSDTDVLDAHLTLDQHGEDGWEAVIEGAPLPLDEDSKNQEGR